MIGRYQSPEIEEIFSQEQRFAYFLEIEALLLEELAKDYPIGAAQIRALRALKRHVDAAAILKREATTRHEITAFLEWVWSRLPRARAIHQYLHFGLTSNDLMDTALALQMKEAMIVVGALLEKNLRALKDLSRRWRAQPVMGRTHGMHAEPISLGLKFLSFYTEGKRNLERLKQCRGRATAAKLSGSVGNFASSVIGPAKERLILSRLGLEPEPVATQVVARDRHAEMMLTLALIGGWAERIAVEIRHSQRTEVAELAEPFVEGEQHGSSSMPHKRNPVLSENLCGLARLLRGYSAVSLENMALWHERDISHSSAERVIIPDAFHVSVFMLKRLYGILSGLVVRSDHIEKNLRLQGDLGASQAYLNQLIAAGCAREKAYNMVQRAVRRAVTGKSSLWQELLKEAGKTPLQRVTDKDFLRHTQQLYDRAFKS